VISKDGLKVSPEKVRAIQEMPAPIDVADVKRVLGFVQYFVKTLLLLAIPMSLYIIFHQYA
jgi:hypothetical protein